jgi:hypothetical protein
MYTNIPVVIHPTEIQIRAVHFKAALLSKANNEKNLRYLLHRQNGYTKYVYKYCNDGTTSKSIIVEFSVHNCIVPLHCPNTVDSILLHPESCTILNKLPTNTAMRVMWLQQ